MRESEFPICPYSVGDKGEQGEQGDKGVMGLPGPPGLPGQQGEPGDIGEPGKEGRSGRSGDPGPPGPNSEIECGEPGIKGKKGERGEPGPIGPKGTTDCPILEGPKGDHHVPYSTFITPTYITTSQHNRSHSICMCMVLANALVHLSRQDGTDPHTLYSCTLYCTFYQRKLLVKPFH